MSEFRILHLSDLHFCHREAVGLPKLETKSLDKNLIEEYKKANCRFSTAKMSRWPQLKTSIAQLCRDEDNPVDLAVFTGDLSTSGDNVDLRGAHSKINELSKILTQNGIPVCLIPGNHERLGNSYAKVPSNSNPKEYLKQRVDAIRYSREFENIFNVHRRVRVIARIVKGVQRLIVLGVDFSLQEKIFHILEATASRSQKCGMGWVESSLLEELAQLTDAEREDATIEGHVPVLVWAIHFPPYSKWDKSVPEPFEKAPEHLQLIESKKLLNQAKNQEVGCILAGHHHWPHLLEIEGVTLSVAGSALEIHATQGNYFHLLTIDTSVTPRSIKVQDYLYTNAQLSQRGFLPLRRAKTPVRVGLIP